MGVQTSACTLNLREMRGMSMDGYQEWEDGCTPDKKTRQLLMLALACVCRCPQCTQEHVQGALEVGATRDDVAEVMLMAFYCAKQLHGKHSCSGFAGTIEGPGGAPHHRGDDAGTATSGKPEQERHEQS